MISPSPNCYGFEATNGGFWPGVKPQTPRFGFTAINTGDRGDREKGFVDISEVPLIK